MTAYQETDTDDFAANTRHRQQPGDGFSNYRAPSEIDDARGVTS